MKTQPMRPLSPDTDDLMLTDEVLVVLPVQKSERRQLLGYSLLWVANAFQAKVPFELRRLNQDLLARFDGVEITGRVDVLALLRPMESLLKSVVDEVAASVLKAAQRAQSRKESPTG